MPAKLQELAAIYLHELHRFENETGDIVVIEARLDVPEDHEDAGRVVQLKGPADVDELRECLSYNFYGRWSTYYNKRERREVDQFHFDMFTKRQPYDRSGVIAYLCEAGAGNGLGRARADALWNAFGSDAIRIFRERPEECLSALINARLPISDEQCELIAAWLEEEKHIETCKLELTELLARRGLPKTTIRDAIREWGNQAATFIRNNPYRLMSFRGCGFKRTDAMYLDLGLPPNTMKRQALCAWHSIAKNTDGHTWFPLDIAISGIKANVSGAAINPPKALKLAKRGKALSFMRTGARGELVDAGGRIWVAERRKARNEERLAEYLARALAEPVSWPVDLEQASRLTDHQREKLTESLNGTVSILGGSPGTGKTFTAAELIGLITREVGYENIAVCAPTGKAAVRVTEALQSYGLNLRARTIHSLLGVASNSKSGGWGFQHDENNPLPYRFLIVDESSMIDTDLLASLLAARATGCHVLFVGDVNQLPPVGHGAPLRDMIAANLPYGELREIRRNSGAIVEVCAAIRDGKAPVGCQVVDIANGQNFKVIEKSGPEQQIEAMLAAIRCAREEGLDPIWDCQVLVPVNAKSPLARKTLNDILQRELNKHPAVTNSPFRIGDKIVNTKNGWFRQYEDGGKPSPGSNGDTFDEDGESSEEKQTNDAGEVYVANGELGRVIQAEAKYVVVKLSSPARTIVVPRGQANDDEGESGQGSGDDKGPSTGCSWDLGYALSVHKSQGSEWPIIIGMIDEYPGAKKICDRSWVYTLISRAKRLCLMIGKQQAMQAFCRKQSIQKRHTFLRELIVRERAKLQAEVLTQPQESIA